MALAGQGALAIWNGITGEGEEDFYRWHNGEHMPERVGVPGFLRGRRYLHAARPRDYFTLYETESVETIRSAPYLARLDDPTPWTRRVLPHFRDTARVGCRVVSSVGRGQGGALLTVRLHPAAGREAALRAALTGAATETVRALAGFVGVHILEPAPETTRIQTVEKALRGVQPGEAEAREPWVVLVEANDPEVIEVVAGAPLRLALAHAEPGAAAGVYRLQISLDRV